MDAASYDRTLDELGRELTSSIEPHARARSLDAFLYNGGTAIVLLCTGLATFLPTAAEGMFFWLPRAFAAFATAWIALDRALGFGPRWRFHVEMENLYRSLRPELIEMRGTPEDQRAKRVEVFVGKLASVRLREHQIPGSGQDPGTGNGG